MQLDPAILVTVASAAGVVGAKTIDFLIERYQNRDQITTKSKIWFRKKSGDYIEVTDAYTGETIQLDH